jgi:predicted RNA binding protein YcfA (HicA-like mRNA interferase family)
MRNVGFIEFRHLIEAFGFTLRRVSGSHHIYTPSASSTPAQRATAPEGSEAIPNQAIS